MPDQIVVQCFSAGATRWVPHPPNDRAWRSESVGKRHESVIGDVEHRPGADCETLAMNVGKLVCSRHCHGPTQSLTDTFPSRVQSKQLGVRAHSCETCVFVTELGKNILNNAAWIMSFARTRRIKNIRFARTTLNPS